jgi:multimeric flavodoxin WrbA
MFESVKDSGGELAGKVGAVYVTSGEEETTFPILRAMLRHGMIVVGNAPSTDDTESEVEKVRRLGKKVKEITEAINLHCWKGILYY